MLKKYGWKYVLANIGAFLLSFYWPFAFFCCYMFKDEKDEEKRRLIKNLNITATVWLVLQIIAIICKFISELIEKGII